MSTLNAITAGAGGVALSGDTSGNLTIQSAGTNVAAFNTVGCMGLNTTPSTWGSGFTAIDYGVNSAIYDVSGYTGIAENCYYNSGWKYKTTGAATKFEQTAGSQYWQYAASGSAGAAISFTQAMTIASDGGIYLGTTTSGGATGITFSNASDSASYGKSIYLNSPYNGTRNAISFAYNSGGVGAIVTGTSSTSYNSGSDYRLKDNPQPLTGSGDFIDSLQPKSWTWKADNKKGVGFIAHEVQSVSPDSVHGEKDAVDADGKPIIQTMEYGSSEFIANIILELQTLRKRVAALEAKVGA